MIRFPLTLLLTGILAAPLAAQVVRGSVAEEGSGAAVEAAMVVLLDSDGNPRASAWTDPAGRYVLRAPGPGSWQLRVDRIGHVSTVSAIFSLAPGETRVQDLEVGVDAVRLEGLVVQTGRRCTLRPDEGAETARLWQEVRKALAAAAWTEAMGVYRYRLTRFVREHDPRRAVDRPERIERDEGFWRWPFESLPVEDLIENGFVRHTEGGLMYSAPDANVLLSDLFLDTHCFRVHGEGREGAVRGLLGLAFEPVPGRRRVPEVRGVLWVDPESAELRRLEYRYTQLHSVGLTAGEDRAGGTVVFEAMPNGAWIIREWSVRMPVVETTWARLPDLSAGGTRGHSAVTIQEKGARVDEVWDGDGRVAFAEDPAPAPAAEPAVAASEDRRNPAALERAPRQPTSPAAEAAPVPAERDTLSESASSDVERIPAPVGEGRMVRGVVREPGTNETLGGVEVHLLDEEGRSVARTVTDAAGRFRFDPPPAGWYRVRTLHLGRGEVLTDPFRLDGPEREPIAPELELVTEVAPIELEPLRVVTERLSRRLDQVGFYERQKTASGPFIVAEQIEAMSAQRLIDVLRGQPGVRVVLRGSSYDVIMAGGGSVSVSGSPCLASIVLDGAVVRPGGVGAERWVDLVPPSEIEGIEVYPRSVGLPVGLGARSPCGAIMIWTKQ